MTTQPAVITGSYTAPELSDEEFHWFTGFLRDWTGIELRPGKQTLVMGRLERRVRHHQLPSYTAYFRLLGRRDDPEETRLAIDLMTTNETYFFREPDHFTLLPGLLPEFSGRPLRVWSAAASTGEEACTIALTLADAIPKQPWEILGTDLSTRVIETARRGLYPIEAAAHIPDRLLSAHCRKGRGDYEGFLTLAPELRDRIKYHRTNLLRPLHNPGAFDVIFLRNVLIYFNNDTKRQVVERVIATLRPGGVLFISHAETLTGLGLNLKPIGPSIYRPTAIR